MGSGVASSISPPETCECVRYRAVRRGSAIVAAFVTRFEHPNSGREHSMIALEVWSSLTAD